MKNNLIIYSVYSILFFLNFIISEKLRTHFIKFKEISRKYAHISSGIIALSFPYYIKSHWTVLFLVIIFMSTMLITMKKNFLTSIHDVGRKSYGSIYYPLAIYLIFFLAKNSPEFYFISILVLTISDAFAALIGKKYGKIKFEIEGNIKSLEGSICFFFITFLCVLMPMLFMTNIGQLESILISTIIAILLTGFEAISPTGSDNIIIPFGTYFLLMKMTSLPLDIIIEDICILIIVVIITASLYVLKPTGLIGMMLLNYAAFTLGGLSWFIPLLITEILFLLLITLPFYEYKKEKFSIMILFYLGIIPTILIFIANTFNNYHIVFIPYVVSIASQIPLSYYFYSLKNKYNSYVKAYVLLSPLIIILFSIKNYFQSFDAKLILTCITSTYLIYYINKQIHRKVEIKYSDKTEYRIRLISTLIGSYLSYLFSYPGVING